MTTGTLLARLRRNQECQLPGALLETDEINIILISWQNKVSTLSPITGSQKQLLKPGKPILPDRRLI
ncbi:hypothetical protein RRG08_002219 [Elysia crispata]|uniref:Uncharacterized protein n=1 Tax=Elysia crispata TaxID=231223 RepID=A0AAE1DCZ7_9GAST|nr:hypothetical protein RRG08_002219 [Elysia crispata]